MPQLGPMSREMKGTEVDAFEKKYGYKPTPIRTSVDALAVFVNKDNPIKCMTIAQADAVFSKSRRQGYKEDITTWGQLGLTGESIERVQFGHPGVVHADARQAGQVG